MQFIILMAQAPFRFINRLAKVRGSLSKSTRAAPMSAHRIRIVESPSFQDMGPSVATLLRWSYFDLRDQAGDETDQELQNEMLKGIRRQSRVVLSCATREVQVKEPDGLTVVVDDVCDLNQRDPARCLQKIMLALRPAGTEVEADSDERGDSKYRGRPQGRMIRPVSRKD